MRQPESMTECVYFTNRQVEGGMIRAWVFKEKCPECDDGLMGKPRDEKTGKAKIRAKEYVCPNCKHTVEKQPYEDTLTACVDYTCPHCQKSGEIEIPYKRKKVKFYDEAAGKDKSADALQFKCEHCGEKINITKKMK
jgi:uncharacterized CHY-type Zn-finger protein